MKNITVVARIIIKKEYHDEVYDCLVKLHKLTNENDEGCIFYNLHKDLEKENAYVFIEKWENKKALESHSQKEHFLNFVKFTDGKLEDMNVDLIEELVL